MFQPDAQICKSANELSESYDVKSFIEPRRMLLKSDKYTDFYETETHSKTLAVGSIAQRWSVYEKSWNEKTGMVLWTRHQVVSLGP